MSNGFAGYFLPNFGIALTGGTGSFTAPPRDKVEIIGDGNTKGINVNSIIFSLNLSRLSHLLMYVRACVNLLLDISQLDQLLWLKMTK